MIFQSGRMWLLLLVAFALAGCALGERGPIFQRDPYPLNFSSERLPSGQYAARVDNIQILIDTSASMAVNGYENLQSARNFINSLNETLPRDFKANTGLRIFGDDQQFSKEATVLPFGMAPYSHDEISREVAKINYARGRNPLGAAITAAAADFEEAGGTSALIIVSDGSWSWFDAPKAVKAVKEKMGDKFCVYTVWVGNIVGTHTMLDKVAEADGCGFAETGSALTDQETLADYVEKVFLTRLTAVPTPLYTPLEKPVEPFVFTVFFDFDKDVIAEEMLPTLRQAKKAMNEDITETFVVSGHADDIGSLIYNQALSERRAVSVKNWLVNNGIAVERLDVVGYGETQPREINATPEGRRLNRRVEIVPEP